MKYAFTLAALASVAIAAPPTAPRITDFTYSGNGCPSSQPKPASAVLGDSLAVKYSGFTGDDTNNCQVHLQASGATQGWQVAVKGVSVSGDVTLKSGSSLDTIATVFWSEHAGDTTTLRASIPCNGPEIKDSFTLSQTTNDLVWSKCTDGSGNTGILNVNFRPIIQGNYGKYDIKSSTWSLQWRKC